MHSFPVFLALVVINVAQTSPVPQVEPNFIATSVTQLENQANVKLPDNVRPFKRRALVRVCIVNGQSIPEPAGGHCDGEMKYVQSDDPILHAKTKPLIGNPLDTSADSGVDEKHPGIGLKVNATILGLHLGDGRGNGDPAVASPNSPADNGNGNDDLLGGIGGIKFLGLGGPHNTDSNSNSGSSSNSDSNAGASDGRDGRNGDTASIATTLLGSDSRGSGSQSSGSTNGGGGDDGDDSFIPGVPIFAGHYGSGANQPHNPPGGDHGHNGGGEDHGSTKGDHGQGGSDGGGHGQDGPDGSDSGQDGYEGSDGDDHGDDGYEGGEGYEGYDGYEGGSHRDGGPDGDDHPHGDDGSDGQDHDRDGPHSQPGSDTNAEDCDEDDDKDNKSSHSSALDDQSHDDSGLDHPPHSESRPEHSPNLHSKSQPWSHKSKPSSLPPNHHLALHDPKDRPPHRHDPPSNSQSSPSSPHHKWEDSKPQCGCDE